MQRQQLNMTEILSMGLYNNIQTKFISYGVVNIMTDKAEGWTCFFINLSWPDVLIFNKVQIQSQWDA